MWFYQRLYGDFNAIKVYPRVFLISSHEPEDPYKISARLLIEDLFQGEKPKLLDPRAMFVIQGVSNEPVYIWIGSQLPQGNLKPYMNMAQKLIKNLQKYEKAN